MERRKTTDFWAKLLFYLNILAWILLVVILLIFHRAQPEFESVFDRFYRLRLRTYWDIQYLYYLIYVVTTGIVISLAGLILGLYRGRREKDHKKALIIMGVMSVICLWVSVTII